jgi:hypothetical protein
MPRTGRERPQVIQPRVRPHDLGQRGGGLGRPHRRLLGQELFVERLPLLRRLIPPALGAAALWRPSLA